MPSTPRYELAEAPSTSVHGKQRRRVRGHRELLPADQPLDQPALRVAGVLRLDHPAETERPHHLADRHRRQVGRLLADPAAVGGVERDPLGLAPAPRPRRSPAPPPPRARRSRGRCARRAAPGGGSGGWPGACADPTGARARSSPRRKAAGARAAERRRRPLRPPHGRAGPTPPASCGASRICSATRSNNGRVRLATMVAAGGGGCSRRFRRSTWSSATPLAARWPGWPPARRARCPRRSPAGSRAGRRLWPARPSRSPGRRASPAARVPSSSSRQSRVVGCAPVPNACAGSTTTSSCPRLRIAPGRADDSRPPTSTRLVEGLPALGPVVRDLAPAYPHQHACHLGLALGQRGQLPRSAVQRVLDQSLAVDLLDARRGQLEQLRQHPSAASEGARTASRISGMRA